MINLNHVIYRAISDYFHEDGMINVEIIRQVNSRSHAYVRSALYQPIEKMLDNMIVITIL